MTTNCKRCGVGIVAGHGHAVVSDLFCNTCFIWRKSESFFRPMSDIPNTPDFHLTGCLKNGNRISLTVAVDFLGRHYLLDLGFTRRTCSEFVGWIPDTTRGAK